MKKNENKLHPATIFLSQKHTRLALVERSLYWFGRYYFSEFFTHKSPRFHLKLIRALEFRDDFKYLLLKAYKESAKTSWAKIALIHKIVFNQKKFCGYVCHDKHKAESALYDVANHLQANKKIIEDFGQLFYEPTFAEGAEKKSRKKSIDEFVTSNGIKVKAYSTAQSTRGEIHMSHRPDFFILDDFENEKTKKSIPRTQEVKDFIDELLSGVSASANIVFLCNKISNKGSVAFLENKAAENKDFKTIEQKLIVNGKITWKSKFVFTDKEANEINSKLKEKSKFVFSIQERKRTLGVARFNQEYQLKPINDADSSIRPEWLEQSLYSAPLDKFKLKTIIMFDPQAGEKKGSDSFGLCVLGFYPKDKNRYLLKIKSGKASQLDQAALLIRTWLEFKDTTDLVGCEKILNQVAVYQTILEWKMGLKVFDPEKYPDLQNCSRNIPFRSVEPRGRDGGVMKDKKARLQMHEPAIERGELHLHVSMEKFKQKLIAFPDVEHDDDIDAMIYCLDYSYSNLALSQNKDNNDSNKKKKETLMGDILNEKF